MDREMKSSSQDFRNKVMCREKIHSVYSTYSNYEIANTKLATRIGIQHKIGDKGRGPTIHRRVSQLLIDNRAASKVADDDARYPHDPVVVVVHYRLRCLQIEHPSIIHSLWRYRWSSTSVVTVRICVLRVLVDGGRGWTNLTVVKIVVFFTNSRRLRMFQSTNRALITIQRHRFSAIKCYNWSYRST